MDQDPNTFLPAVIKIEIELDSGALNDPENGLPQSSLLCISSDPKENLAGAIQRQGAGEKNDGLFSGSSNNSTIKPNDQLPCDICKDSSANTRGRGHVQNKSHCCQYCTKTFSKTYDFNRHMQTHTNQKPYSCNLCTAQFSCKRYLTAHEQTHVSTKKKAYRCDLCKKSFPQKCHLMRHVRCVHTKEKPYSCGICKESFSRNYNLTLHKRNLHSKEKPDSPVKYLIILNDT